MATVSQRPWRLPGQRAKRKAWGFTAQALCSPCPHRHKVTGEILHPTGVRQVRCYRAEWTREDAERALAALLLQVEQRPKLKAHDITFGQAIERYVQAKARKKSLMFDKLYLDGLKAAFGADTPLAEIGAAKVSAWKAERLTAINPRTKLPYAAATINRPLAALRHLLRLAHEDGLIREVPKIRLEREPEGRIRWLEPHEEVQLLAACHKSRNRELTPFVTIALETGLRRGELLGLTWDRVDLSRGVIRLEVTKSAKRREVPMRQGVYNILASLPEPREGRVFRTRKIRTAFENAVAAARLDDFRLHDCRHHFASWFVMRGGSLQALKELLGHADLKMTLRYAHLAPDHLRSEIAKTERPAHQAGDLAQGSAQAVNASVGILEASRKSLF